MILKLILIINGNTIKKIRKWKDVYSLIELGRIQKLEVLRSTSIGVYLNSKDDKSEDDILLPKKQIPEDVQIGDEIEVFVYRDSEDRMIATTNRPKLTVGELGMLKVVETTRVGAFLDWGLEKDVLLPFKEQTTKVQTDKEYLVGLYIDKSDRLCATMNISKLLEERSPYEENDRVEGVIYRMKSDIGAFIAVDNKYHGLVHKTELYGDYKLGDRVEGRVTKVREDGKLDISLREKSYKQMDEDAKKIMDSLTSNGGVLGLNDNSSPEEIKRELNMSKSAFKRAIGKLLKNGNIRFAQNRIEIKNK